MRNSIRRGLGFYLLLFFIGFCIVLWLQNRSQQTDTTYTIDDFKSDINEELISDVEIYQNSPVFVTCLDLVSTTSSIDSSYCKSKIVCSMPCTSSLV